MIASADHSAMHHVAQWLAGSFKPTYDDQRGRTRYQELGLTNDARPFRFEVVLCVFV